jgi:copper chaperone CopZ
MKLFRFACVLSLLTPSLLFAQAKKDEPQVFTFSILGLFMPDREQDFRDLMKECPEIKLDRLSYKDAEADFEFIPAKVFPGAKPQEIVTRLDTMIRLASRQTFGVKPARTTPLEKLKWIEIDVAGLDCKACSLAAYEAIAKLDGVEQATASFKTGKAAALIDPAKTNRETLVEALVKKGVAVSDGKSPPKQRD